MIGQREEPSVRKVRNSQGHVEPETAERRRQRILSSILCHGRVSFLLSMSVANFFQGHPPSRVNRDYFYKTCHRLAPAQHYGVDSRNSNGLSRILPHDTILEEKFVISYGRCRLSSHPFECRISPPLLQ